MACYHPYKGFILGVKENGKKNIKITPFDYDYIQETESGKLIPKKLSAADPFGKFYDAYDIIPCGKCIGCQIQRSREWANRGVNELQYHDHNLFITLTYNDDNLPYLECENGITHWTLDKKDLQLFWKRLRKYTGYDKIRYLACGEYGENTYRPHYHAIVYGLDLPDKVIFSKSPTGDLYYVSETLEKIWNKGHVLIGDVTHESIAYVARYTTKKLYGEDSKYYEEFNLIPPFITMSRRPGIGYQYYEDNKEKLFTESKYYFPTKNGIGSAVPGRYYNNLFVRDFSASDVESRKDNMKKRFNDANDIKLSKTDLNYLDYLENLEYIKSKSLKALVRNKV